MPYKVQDSKVKILKIFWPELQGLLPEAAAQPLQLGDEEAAFHQLPPLLLHLGLQPRGLRLQALRARRPSTKWE